MAVTKILVVDDEDTLCEVLKFNLEIAGFSVDVANSAEEALQMKPLSQYSLILLDIMMAQMSGFTFARILKADDDTKNIPIIFLTAKDNEDDMVAGLNIGADDYIYKPYTIRNVMTRVNAVLRRTLTPAVNSSAEKNVITIENLTVDPDAKTVTLDGKEIKMPRKEFEILLMLVSCPGRIFSRNEILSRVWEQNVVVVDRVVDVNITRLRKKLGDLGNKIITRSGYGYGFEI
ncbi:MAG: response regulator transcription factor [Muribaculaceae bacterium]